MSAAIEYKMAVCFFGPYHWRAESGSGNICPHYLVH